MKKMLKKALKGFTLVELIVVIAIIAILSTVGFVSYTGYIRDSRNAVRQSDLSEATNVITQFIAQNGRAPVCNSGTTFCYFAPDSTLDTTAETASKDSTITGGIKSTDWYGDTASNISGLNVRKAPLDPKKVYYIYGSSGDKFAIFATKEETSGYSTIIQGSDSNLPTALNLKGCAVDATSYAIDCTAGKGVTITANNQATAVPYNPAAGTTSQVQLTVTVVNGSPTKTVTPSSGLQTVGSSVTLVASSSANFSGGCVASGATTCKIASMPAANTTVTVTFP
jgi:type IV pilus assembly protein PilE